MTKISNTEVDHEGTLVILKLAEFQEDAPGDVYSPAQAKALAALLVHYAERAQFYREREIG